MAFTVGLDTSALDCDFKSHALRGIGRYVSELKRYFDSHPELPLKVDYFNHSEVHRKSRLSMLGNLLPAGRTTFKQQFVYPFALSRDNGTKFNTVHFPAHMDAPAWGLKRYLITVLDLIPLVCSDLYSAGRSGMRYYFARWLERKAITNASLVLTISENTARDVNRLLGVPEERIIVTYLGVDKRFFDAAIERPQAEELRIVYGIPLARPILLYVGGIDPRKNYSGLLKSMQYISEHFSARSPAERPVLVMAGRIDSDREYPNLLNLISKYNLKDNVVLPGFMPDEELLSLYAMSSVFLFPSLYEGFGLPPLEAMAAGVPVVSSNTSSLPEVLGEAAVLVSPKDSEVFAKEVCAILQNDEHAERLSQAGRVQARRFSWDKTGAATVSAYERLWREESALL